MHLLHGLLPCNCIPQSLSMIHNERQNPMTYNDLSPIAQAFAATACEDARLSLYWTMADSDVAAHYPNALTRGETPLGTLRDSDHFDLSPQACADVERFVKDFVRNALPHIVTLRTVHAWSDDAIGHDLYMTFVGHGVGFWDRGLGELGDTLSELAGHGECYVWQDSRGIVHLEGL